MNSRAFLPSEKFQTVQQLHWDLQLHPLTMISVCLRILGHKAVCTYIMQYVRLCLYPPQWWLKLVYRSSCRHGAPLSRCLQKYFALYSGGWNTTMCVRMSPFPTLHQPKQWLLLPHDRLGEHLGTLKIQSLWSETYISLLEF